MADRFPSIEEFSGGTSILMSVTTQKADARDHHLWMSIGQTDRRGDPGLQLDPTTSNGVDFLAREKAALGDDADLFASADNKQQNTDDDDDDDDDDLLGDDHSSVKKGDLAGEAMSDFQSAFPAINIDNPVRLSFLCAPGVSDRSIFPGPSDVFLHEFGEASVDRKC